jgi:hypothetical protein
MLYYVPSNNKGIGPGNGPSGSRIEESENGRKRVRTCRDCKAIVQFFDNVRGRNHARIPHDMDGSRHTCALDLQDEESICLAAIRYVGQLNKLLGTTQLRVLREERVNSQK